MVLGSCITAPKRIAAPKYVTMMIGDDPYQIQVASTEEEKRLGLSHRETLEPEEGMLFLFDKPDYVTFWMKDTKIPLSIAWIDEEGRIYGVTDMVPMSLALITSPVKVIAVIELPQGSFLRSGARLLDQIIIDQCSLENTTVLFPEMMIRCSK